MARGNRDRSQRGEIEQGRQRLAEDAIAGRAPPEPVDCQWRLIMGVTIVSVKAVKAKTAGDTRTGRVANQPAGEEASRAAYKGAGGSAERPSNNRSPAPAAVGTNRAATMNAIAITRSPTPPSHGP